MFLPFSVDEYVQDTAGHWYRVLEVQALGWRYKVDPVYVSHASDAPGEQRYTSRGWRPIVMGLSELKPRAFERS
jgi:hypothetical protein